MQAFARMSIYGLLGGILLATSGCVLGPDRDHDRGYYNDGYSQQDQRYRYEDRDQERRRDYERCREEGGHDCDDILHH